MVTIRIRSADAFYHYKDNSDIDSVSLIIMNDVMAINRYIMK